MEEESANTCTARYINNPLVPKNIIFFPYLHIKIDFTEKFVKTLNNDGDFFKYKCRQFSDVYIEIIQWRFFDRFFDRTQI